MSDSKNVGSVVTSSPYDPNIVVAVCYKQTSDIALECLPWTVEQPPVIDESLGSIQPSLPELVAFASSSKASAARRSRSRP